MDRPNSIVARLFRQNIYCSYEKRIGPVERGNSFRLPATQHH
jgi:hypothetical protein